MLTLKDFKEVNLEQALPHWYYSMKRDGFELTLEPCMGGYDVALYFDEQLFTPKICTNIKHPTTFGGTIDATKRAVSFANDLWKERHNG